LDRVELGNFGDYKILDEGVSDLRLDFGPGFRIYFAEEDEVIVILLCGGNKSTQKKTLRSLKNIGGNWWSAAMNKEKFLKNTGDYHAQFVDSLKNPE
jgi:putative addiction module killer protein